MKQIKLAILACGMLLSLSAIPVQAAGIWDGCTAANKDSDICSDTTGATNVVKNLINTLLFAVGILSVIMIIHSGLKYTTSRGDAEQVKSAKNTLLYAVVGLVVALMAYAIVNFVIGAFKTQETSSQGQSGSAAQ